MNKTIEERLHDVARRKNALGKYCVTYTAESILEGLENKVAEEERWKAESDARKAKDALQDAEDLRCLDTFAIGDSITFVRGKNTDGSDRVEKGTVEKIMEKGHTMAPCMMVSDSFTKSLPQLWQYVKPSQHKATHSQ